MSLFDDSTKKSKIKIGYGDLFRAKMTIKNIKKLPINKRRSLVLKMYNRAKYHKNQTSDMRKSMKFFKKWLNKKTSK